MVFYWREPALSSPQIMHKEMIQLLHTWHLRLEKCLNRAKQSMYWPSLYDELKDLITNCTTCLKFSAQKPTSNKQHTGHEIPVHPWSKLASDIFYFEGDSYLLIVDYTSCFPIIRKLSSMTRKAIVHHMQSIFSEYGWPDTLVTDNGPCYTSKEFQILLQSMVCQPPYQLSPLSTEQWTWREICWNHQELVPQSKRRRPIPLHSSYGL